LGKEQNSSLIVIALGRDLTLLQGVEGFFETLIVDGSKATSRRLECVMLFMLKYGACALVWTWRGGRTPLIL